MRRYCTAEPIREFDRISPVSVTKTEQGYLYDFGINDAGYAALKSTVRPVMRSHSATASFL